MIIAIVLAFALPLARGAEAHPGHDRDVPGASDLHESARRHHPDPGIDGRQIAQADLRAASEHSDTWPDRHCEGCCCSAPATTCCCAVLGDPLGAAPDRGHEAYPGGHVVSQRSRAGEPLPRPPRPLT